ncbi:MAG TPA: metallophosphoesterase [Cerasibacillus sp.]|uniref:metallophosphoesterase n=1 Tax=Cerasibacillus sp. TaxID=2498711 RepID=UPI002F3E296E
MNRRTFIKRMIGSGLLLIGLGSGSYYYARHIEPNRLHIQHETITSHKIPPAFNQFKIVQFSDTHIGFHYTTEQFSKLIDKINQLQPDLIVFTGDFVDRPHQFHWNNELNGLLKSLVAPYGKYWIYGNHDHGGYGTDILKKFMKDADFHLLQNTHTRINHNQEEIILAGIDDAILGKPDIDGALKNNDSNLFTILLAHEPDLAKYAKHYSVDVQLSGHSHGGQVRLPFFGHLYTPIYAKKYTEGRYQVTDDFTLFVNRGIGTTRLPFRFLCTPEIHVYQLKHKTI